MPDVLQLDFDGTVIVDDASISLLTAFTDAAWRRDYEAAQEAMLRDPGSGRHIDVVRAGLARIRQSRADCLAWVREHHTARPGLSELVSAAERRSMPVHVTGYAFDFYVGDYLREAGVLDRVELHCGRTREANGGIEISYTGPDGEPISRAWKETWIDHFRRAGNDVVYVGDGRSDVGAALRARLVFARDDLLTNMPPSFEGIVCEFDTLLDVAQALDEGL